MSSNEWKTCTIGSLCTAVYDGPHATPEKTLDGPIFLGISSLKNGRIDLSDTEHLSEEDFVKWTRRVTPQPDDLVFSYETRLGEAALIPDGLYCCLGRRMALLRFDKTKVAPKFMLYAYLGPEFQQTIRSRTVHGSTVDRIPLIEFPDFPITIPSLSTQHRIADILSALDEKIELNRQTNATLEALAQAIFKEWFVDFNFPGATGEMVESELGMIPKGWGVMPLDEVANFLNGLALQKYPPENERDYLPAIKIRELKNGVTDSSDKVSRYLPEKYIIHDGDLIFSWSGSLEVKIWVGGEGALNQHLFKVTSNKFPLWFCYFWILYHLENFRKIAEDKTTTMGHIQREHLSNALCLVPDNLVTMDNVLQPIIEKAVNTEKESITLAHIRDALLPKLMSGEIEV